MPNSGVQWNWGGNTRGSGMVELSDMYVGHVGQIYVNCWIVKFRTWNMEIEEPRESLLFFCPCFRANSRVWWNQVPVKPGSKMINVCFEPKSFAVEIDTDNGKEFATTKLTTRQTYTLAFIEGNLELWLANILRWRWSAQFKNAMWDLKSLILIMFLHIFAFFMNWQ